MKDFSSKSSIPYSTLYKIINGMQRNTELKTIIKIVDFFDCSLDEVNGRINDKIIKKVNYSRLSLEEMGKNLKDFLNNKLTELSLNCYQLSKKCGFSDVALYDFMQENSNKKALGSTVIIGLADYFGISLDEMVGRKTLSSSSNVTTQTLESLNEKGLQALEQIRLSVSSDTHKIPGSPKHSPVKPTKSLTR